MSDDASRRTAFSGFVRLAGARVRYRLTQENSRQTLLAVVGVALAVTLVLSVTSVSLGLASQGSLTSEQTDYWIVPEESQGSAVTGVEGVSFGRVHPVADRLQRRSDVAYTTPVLLDVIRVTSADQSEPLRVFVVGIIPKADGGTVVGLPTDQLQPGDPYYDNGSYNGTWTGEAVVSRSAQTSLNLSDGETIAVPGRGSSENGHRLTVVDSSPAEAPGIAQFPVVVVHLSEAQRLVGATANDEADRFLVDTTDPSAKEGLASVYPNSKVVAQQGLLAHNLQSSDLPLAMSIAAGIIAIVTGVLSVVTTAGFQVADDAQSRAVMAAVGVSRWARGGLVALETLVTAAIGGVIGVAGWLLVVAIVNVAATQTVAVPVAVVRPVLGLYGIVAALVVGGLAVPFVLLFTNREPLTEVLG
jgi:putative ABC transport system permease protein